MLIIENMTHLYVKKTLKFQENFTPNECEKIRTRILGKLMGIHHIPIPETKPEPPG